MLLLCDNGFETKVSRDVLTILMKLYIHQNFNYNGPIETLGIHSKTNNPLVEYIKFKKNYEKI